MINATLRFVQLTTVSVGRQNPQGHHIVLRPRSLNNGLMNADILKGTSDVTSRLLLPWFTVHDFWTHVFVYCVGTANDIHWLHPGSGRYLSTMSWWHIEIFSVVSFTLRAFCLPPPGKEPHVPTVHDAWLVPDPGWTWNGKVPAPAGSTVLQTSSCFTPVVRTDPLPRGFRLSLQDNAEGILWDRPQPLPWGHSHFFVHNFRHVSFDIK